MCNKFQRLTRRRLKPPRRPRPTAPFYLRHAPDVAQVWSGPIRHQKVAWTVTTTMTAAMWKSMPSIATLIGRADLARPREHSMRCASRSSGPEVVGGMPGLRWGRLAGAESTLASACGAAGGWTDRAARAETAVDWLDWLHALASCGCRQHICAAPHIIHASQRASSALKPSLQIAARVHS